MDMARLGVRSRRAVAIGLLMMIGAVVPSAAAAAPAGVPVDPKQSALDAQRTGPGFQVHVGFHGNQQQSDVNVCSTAIGLGSAHCDARVRTDAPAHAARPARAGRGSASDARGGASDVVGNGGAYDPGFLQSAYNLASLIQSGAGRSQVVALVDAYDSPTAQADMSYYRDWFALPSLPTCASWPSSSPCFRKVNESGATSPLPSTDTGWAAEIALDLDMVSAACPNCTILLVEANSNTYGDLTAAVNKAVALGANVVSNSYGSGEWSGEAGFDSAFDHPGVAMTVSSGDLGYGTQWPAASPYVTAVGGTSLTQLTSAGTRDGSEIAWSDAGSGCSAYETKPSWQKDSGCAKRTVADVSAVADPNTGVWVYDTTGGAGWEILGGTSAASPIVGSIYALAGNSRTSTNLLSSDPYGKLGSLFDVASGSNGSCTTSYLCNGVPGYDGPTGLGTPNGMAAFANPVSALLPDFSLSAKATSLTVVRGGATVSDSLTITAANGYRSPVTLSVKGLPTYVTATFSVNPVTPTATSAMRVHAGSRAVRGTYTLTVTATGADGKVHSQSVRLTVQ